MAGFFGLFDYNKPGKGVRKDEPQKSRFVHFFELFFRKFWKLIQLNLLFVLFCIPVVTIGPALAAHTYVLRNMVTEQPVFLFSDFWDAFKMNWKQSFLFTLILLIFALILRVSWSFYFMNLETTPLMYIPACLCFFMAFMAVLSTFYMYLMIVTLDLPLLAIIKNALILAILRIKSNLITLVILAVLLFAAILFPIIGFLVFLLIGFSLLGFIICYNSYPGIQKFVIDPFLARQAEEEAAEAAAGNGDGEETVFQDEYDRRSGENER